MTATNEIRFPRGARVRMTRRWNPTLARRDGVANITIEGSVESWHEVNGGGYLHLTRCAARVSGWLGSAVIRLQPDHNARVDRPVRNPPAAPAASSGQRITERTKPR